MIAEVDLETPAVVAALERDVTASPPLQEQPWETLKGAPSGESLRSQSPHSPRLLAALQVSSRLHQQPE